ncbi:uncharacterized protein F4822DRAFT_395107 [Hypoxylon trugodes]|uniref:uncharacterized protein n=1 Tax=Hypoxylon trugodes TaxID=326681 RepID=UPI00218FA073|nr:uncharacterized protein F4822DRAFT_395107 [Hypoxylon trugodes]KAI1390997.1 hypothetical protein F4822DRAFT_395107 [Hypoxylon trugodes]
MSSCQRVARPLIQSLRQERLFIQTTTQFSRSFSRSAPRQDEGPTSTPPPPPPTSSTTSINQLEAAAKANADAKEKEAEKIRMQERLMDRETTTAHWAERKLLRMGTPPVGSRRRRAALRTSENVPFEQLPYQCFQEARKILQEDRKQKLEAIAKEVAKIKKLEETPADQVPGGEHKKNMRLTSLRNYLEKLKILADANDPMVKRKFEDGQGTFCNFFLFIRSN